MSLTAEEFTAHIHRISELSGDNEEVMNLLNDIQQDRTEPQFTEDDVFDNDGVETVCGCDCPCCKEKCKKPRNTLKVWVKPVK